MRRDFIRYSFDDNADILFFLNFMGRHGYAYQEIGGGFRVLRDNEQVAFIYSDRELSINGDSPIALAIDDYLRK